MLILFVIKKKFAQKTFHVSLCSRIRNVRHHKARGFSARSMNDLFTSNRIAEFRSSTFYPFEIKIMRLKDSHDETN